MTDHPLVPTHLAVKAMRDNGYRNTAYAVAELIDNAIQAGATSVELLCCERDVLVTQRTRRNIHQVAVLDNGSGMSMSTLNAALQFGNGEHLNDRDGIGRFGMGLPSSSISQCRKVEVWTWQNGPESALYSYINLDDVDRGRQTSVPLPEIRSIPSPWHEAGSAFGASGTLIVWSQLDRCMWKTAQAIIDNSQLLIGRMYRRFINSGNVSIRMASFGEDSPHSIRQETYATTNDPLYLIVPSSTPSPYDQEPMFLRDGDAWEITEKVEFDGEIHEVTTRFSLAKDEVRRNPNDAGRARHGKHAQQNVGISLMRAERELELETSFVNMYDTRERWWGIEVEFPPSLDEVFGVTNNKQSARNFTDVAKTIDSLLDESATAAEVREELRANEDPREPLLEIANRIRLRLSQLRGIIVQQAKGARQGRKRHESGSAEEAATTTTRRRQQEGHEGVSDPDEQMPLGQREQEVATALAEGGYAEEDAQLLAARSVGNNIKYLFAEQELEGRMFFTVSPVAGEVVIKLNTKHPAYKNLVEVLEEDPDEELTQDEAVARLQRAYDGLKLLLIAWSRFEEEVLSDNRRAEIQDIRTDWGRYAWEYLDRGD